MSLLEQLDADLKAAMLSRDEVRKRTLRSVKTAMQNALVEKRGGAGLDAVLSDDDVLKVIAKQANQRRDSIAEFTSAGRMDLVEQEQAELAVLEDYLPQPLSAKEVTQVVKEVIASTGATGPKDMGMVMRTAMAQLGGRADGKMVSQVARELLG